MRIYHGSLDIVENPEIRNNLVDQLLFHTDKALGFLEYKGFDAIEL